MGFLRLALAGLVVLGHIAGVPLIGSSAVIVFFVLSGYLMTFIMHHSYGYTSTGFTAFCLNRFLRLYPTYFLIVALSVILVAVIGDDFTRSYNKAIFLPRTADEFFQTITMVYPTATPIDARPRISPPTWALTVELFNYLLIGIGVTRSRGFALAWFGLGAAYALWAVTMSQNPWLLGYGSIFGGVLPFAVGALIYHYRNEVSALARRIPGAGTLEARGATAPIVLMAAGVAGLIAMTPLRLVAYHVFGWERLSIALYFLTAAPGVLALLGALSWRAASPRIAALDKLCGELSYPLYLAHWIVAIGVAWTLAATTGVELRPGPTLFTVSAPALAALCFLCVLWVDRPINTLRNRVRRQGDLRRITP